MYSLLLVEIKIIKNIKDKDFFTHRTASKKIIQKAIHACGLCLCEGRTIALQSLIFKQINWYFHVTGLKMKTRRDLWLYLKSENNFSVTECLWKTNSCLFIGCIKKAFSVFVFQYFTSFTDVHCLIFILVEDGRKCGAGFKGENRGPSKQLEMK